LFVQFFNFCGPAPRFEFTAQEIYLPHDRLYKIVAVTRSLERQGFVYVFRELVVLADAGRGALIAERERAALVGGGS